MTEAFSLYLNSYINFLLDFLHIDPLLEWGMTGKHLLSVDSFQTALEKGDQPILTELIHVKMSQFYFILDTK